MQMKDQAAVVTGGASGLGAATARKLAALGARVAVCDLNQKLAESVAAEIGGVAVACDVSDASSAEAAVSQASKAHGPARVLVNCAGIGVAKRVIGRELAQFGIRVLTIAPGLFLTPLLANLPQEAQDSLAASIPFPRRLGQADEFASLALHMIDNVYLNGEVVRLDASLRMAPR